MLITLSRLEWESFPMSCWSRAEFPIEQFVLEFPKRWRPIGRSLEGRGREGVRNAVLRVSRLALCFCYANDRLCRLYSSHTFLTMTGLFFLEEVLILSPNFIQRFLFFLFLKRSPGCSPVID